MTPSPLRFPGNQHRHAIIGATGSGKTQAALWHLSLRDFDSTPWVIYNFKSDESIDGIDLAHHIEMDEVPTQPGIYVVHPLPDQESDVETQMWEIWRRGGIGVYVDEGYMIGRNNKAFRALLTQGRSKRVPMIVLSQRPVWMDRFVFSESDFFQVFRLQHAKDRKSVAEFVPANLNERLPEYHSIYYDVAQNQVFRLRPVPDIDSIHNTFMRRLLPLEAKRRKVV
jgi:hypothetical protein